MKKTFSVFAVLAVLSLCFCTYFMPELMAQDATETVTTNIPENAIAYKVVATEADGSLVMVQVDEPDGIFKELWEWFQRNGAAGLAMLITFLSLVEIFVRWTPSKRDDAAFAWLRRIVDFFVPNLKKGGGTFPTPKA